MPARKPENRHLPARWSIRRNAYYFEPMRGDEQHWDGKRLFRLGSTYQEALRTFADRMAPSGYPKGRTLADAFDRYLAQVSPKKAPRSHQNDIYGASFLKPVFGKVRLSEPVQPTWCHQYIDGRADPRTGKPAPVQARKEVALLSAVLSAAVEWGWIRRNDLIGQFRRRKPAPRTRDVTTVDLTAFKAHAPDWLKAFVDLKALLGIRQADMLALRESAAGPEGVLVEPSKTINSTGKRTLFTWTPALRAAWEATLAARPVGRGLKPTSDHLFRTRDGKPYSATSFSSTWQRVMRAAVEAGVLKRFTEHDIRAHVASESATVEEAGARLGHASTATTTRVYRRRAERVTPLR